MAKINNSVVDASKTADEFLNIVFKPDFHRVKYKQKFMISGGSPPTSFKAELSKDGLFEGTEYQVDASDELLHFTTLQGLDSILNSGYLRLSSIENLNDNLELTLALEKVKENFKLKISEEQVINLKQSIFCLSSCLSTPKTILDTYMWENYSKGGSGVAIVFEVKNFNSNLLFGKVQYGNDKLSIFENLTKRIAEYKTNYGEFMPNNLYELMSNIFCFHKSNKYHRENEVRLLISENKYSLWHEHDNLFIEKVINGSNEVRYIYKLVLKEHIEDWYNKNYSQRADITIEDVNRELPQIIIKKIVLGYNAKEPHDIITYLYQKRDKLKMKFEVETINNELEIIKR